MSSTNLAHLLDQAEAAVSAGRRLPFARRRLVNTSPLLELIDQMRLALPQELRQADRLLQSRESVISQSLAEAKKIIADAEKEAKARVQESVIAKAAQKEAEATLAQAREQAEALTRQSQEAAERRRRELEEYALGVLSRLEQYLATTLSTVRHGLEAIRAGKELTLGERERR